MADDGRARTVHRLSDSAAPLSRAYDVAMLDLDGVVYRGDTVISGAVDGLTAVVAEGMRLAYVTNNASRTPEQVVSKLSGMGVPVHSGDVVTSAQAAARLVNDAVPPGSAVLVVGGEGLVEALAEYGLRRVSSADEHPAAVVQGFSPDVDWALLAEGAYAVADGAVWVASNTDSTIPTARGVAPGNGVLVHAIAVATGAVPQVAGKPEPPLFDETVRRVGGHRPLVVGDRLDTDIQGANAVGADSLVVLTGVSSLADLAAAPPALRPTYVGADLAALNLDQPAVVLQPDRAEAGSVAVRCDDAGVLGIDSQDLASDDATTTALLRATVALAWSRGDDQSPGDQPSIDVRAVQDVLEARMR